MRRQCSVHELFTNFLESSQDERSPESLDHRLSAMEFQLQEIKEILMSLTPEVQALVSEVAASKAATHSAVAKLGELGVQIGDLTAKLAAIVPAAPIDAEDLEAIKAATASLGESVTEVSAVLVPAPANTSVDPVADQAKVDPSDP